MNVLTCFIVALVFLNGIFAFFDPISLGIAGIGAGVAWWQKKSVKYYSYCQLYECCTDQYIINDINKLKQDLNNKVYGQHLMNDIVINALVSHITNKNPSKPLTLSFHGWSGSGKNYVSKFIVDNLYYKGGKSNYIHHFIGRINFPLESRVPEYKNYLYNYIKEKVMECPQQLFIFDEVDKMPPKLLNAIKPMIDYNDYVEKVDYRKAIFIFLSNTGGVLITDQLQRLWESGVSRSDVKLKDFENLIRGGAFNEEGGFHHSDTIKSNLIDHYIPFLPLELEHVRKCVEDQFYSRNATNIKEQHMQEVLDTIEWGPAPSNLYSKTGCKRISQKVGLVVQQNRNYYFS